MRYYIIIPFYNEGKYIKKTLKSFQRQTIPPTKLLLIDDGSTDDSYNIALEFTKKNPWISLIKNEVKPIHQPGIKIINAFYVGYDNLDDDFDLIGKFDADIILPDNYFEELIKVFQNSESIGIASGNLYIKENNHWIYEKISDKSKTRGPLKLYSKECFKKIGGLKKSIGWDTVDELLAKYHGWRVQTHEKLHVKHLRPTGKTYTKAAKHKQGEAFYKLRYGFLITFIASLKLALLKKKPVLVKDYLTGYFKAKKNKLPFLVNEKEGKWIRKYRWNKMKQKLF